MIKKHFSLVLRIALPFALLLVLTMGALSMVLSSFIEESFQEILRDSLQSETRLVADRVSSLIGEGMGNAAIDKLAHAYAGQLGVRVTIIDPAGRVLGESDTQAVEMENHLNRPEVQNALRKTASSEIRYSKTLNMEMLYAVAPVLDGERVIGVARLAVSLDAIHRKVNSILSTIFIAMTAATILAILLAYLVATYTIAPLKQLTATVQRVADGHLDEIAPTTRQDEIGRLHQAFQNMAHQLREQIEDLSAERSKLEAVLRDMTDGVIIVDGQGIVQLINPAALRMFAVDDNSGIEKPLIEVVRHHQLVELWRMCQITGKQQTTTLETTPNRVFVQGIATPLAEILPGSVLLVFQDLTRVRRLETVRRDFVSNVSHELRTPLASLKALAETLQEGALEDPPAAHRFLSRMETEIDNLTQLVNELLELTRIESNRFPMRRVSAQPCQLASLSVERMQMQAERANLHLRLECPAELPQVNADPERIEQVLVNLIHNAIKFSLPGGEIVVSTYQEKNNIIFCVRDTGVGISPEALPRIFERFYKIDRSRSGGGTGLGLSIARHIVEAHGGKIWVESVVSQGSAFYFSLLIQN